MLEAIAFKILDLALVNFPIAGALIMLLGVVFIFCEIFVTATPKKEDDAKWKKFKSGYVGPVIDFCINYTKKFFIKK